MSVDTPCNHAHDEGKHLMRTVTLVAIWLLIVGTLCLRMDSPQISTAGPNAKKIHIGIVTNSVSPFWDPMTRGLEIAKEKLGVEATWQGPPRAQVSEQRRIIEDMAAQGVDGIAISPINAEALTPVIDDLVNNGIIVLTMDSDAPNSKRMAYIGTNNVQAGYVAGQEAVKRLPNGGEVIAFVGTLSAMNASERLEGFKKAIEGHNITLLDVKQDQTDKNKARRNVEDAILAYPDVDAFLGLWSYNPPAITAAVKAAGKLGSIQVFGFDAEPQTLAHLENKEIQYTIVQKPYLFGYLSVELITMMKWMGVEETLTLLPKDRIVDTGVEVITPDSVAGFKARLEALGIRSS
ncbi:MAG TPA: sugar-binding protein [bacterium]|nr:sugar-binding protein [bacterium]